MNENKLNRLPSHLNWINKKNEWKKREKLQFTVEFSIDLLILLSRYAEESKLFVVCKSFSYLDTYSR